MHAVTKDFRIATAKPIAQNGLEMAEIFTEFDPAALLETDDDIAIFMADAFESGDVKYIAKAIGIVARVRGMNEMVRKTGLSREQLYPSFSERGNSTLK